tara:strand:- start:287 stop:943 length:657 start_codon:yes stop_codon:yes gene_type:complete
MAAAKQIRDALIKLMRAKSANKADPGGAVYAPDQVTNPGAVTGFRDTNLRDTRRQAREVQGEDPLTPFTAAEHKVETAGMAPSPGKAHLTRTESLGDPSRLPADPVKFDQPAPSMSRDLDTFPDEGTYYGRPPDEIDPADLKRLEADNPEVNVTGTGARTEAVPDDMFRSILESGDGLNDPRLQAYMDANPERGKELVEAIMDQFERGGAIHPDDIPF